MWDKAKLYMRWWSSSTRWRRWWTMMMVIMFRITTTTQRCTTSSSCSRCRRCWSEYRFLQSTMWWSLEIMCVIFTHTNKIENKNREKPTWGEEDVVRWCLRGDDEPTRMPFSLLGSAFVGVGIESALTNVGRCAAAAPTDDAINSALSSGFAPSTSHGCFLCCCERGDILYLKKNR